MARSKITPSKSEKQQLSSSHDNNDDDNNQSLTNRQRIKLLLRKPLVFTFAMNSILALSTLAVLKLVKSNTLVKLYSSLVEPYIAKEDFPLANIFLISLLHSGFALSTVLNRVWSGTKYNPDKPRASEDNLTGASYRLNCAYQNFLDHYPLYMTAVMLSAFKKTNINYQLSFNLIILATRLLHPIGYVLNIVPVRGFSYQSSIVATLLLILSSILKEDKFQSILNYL